VNDTNANTSSAGPYSSQMVKRQRGKGPNFTRSKLNLANLHTRKHEGLVNSQAIGLYPTENGGITLVTKKSDKANKPASQLQTTDFAKHQGGRKTYSSIVNSTAKKGYRADLRQAAVARASALKKSQSAKTSKTHEEKLRGGRAKKAKAVEKV
jgi:large subunit ribosomal protein L28e